MLLLSSADFFQNQFFQTILSGALLECQMVWIQIRSDVVRPDFGLNCLQRLSGDSKFLIARKELNYKNIFRFL